MSEESTREELDITRRRVAQLLADVKKEFSLRTAAEKRVGELELELAALKVPSASETPSAT